MDSKQETSRPDPYNGVERRKHPVNLHEEIDVIKERLKDGETQFGTLTAALQSNTELTLKIAADIAPIVSLAQDLEAGTRFLCRLAMCISWVLKTTKEYWPVIMLLMVFAAYMTNSTKLLEFASKLLKG